MEDQNQLQQIKNEILSELDHRNQKKSRRLSLASGVVTLVLIILAVVSVAQAAQSAVIWQKVKSGNFSAAATAPAASQPTAPDSLQNLPNMAGGC